MIRTVGIAELAVSDAAEDVIVTHALGSCLGITVYDPVAGVGGLLHVMLPLSTIDNEKARQTPCTFVDTGVPLLFRECYKLGALKARILVTVAGGSTPGSRNEDEDFFQIGKRNMIMLRKLLWKNAVALKATDVGGNGSRQMRLRLEDGGVFVKTENAESLLFRPRGGDNEVRDEKEVMAT